MSLQYIRNYYGVPAKMGGRVEVFIDGDWTTGTIVGGTHSVIVRPDNDRRSRRFFHPEDAGHIRYLSEGK